MKTSELKSNESNSNSNSRNTLLTRFAASQHKKESGPSGRTIEDDLAELQMEVKKTNISPHGKVGVGLSNRRGSDGSSHKHSASSVVGAAGGTDLNSIITGIKKDNIQHTQRRQIGMNSM